MTRAGSASTPVSLEPLAPPAPRGTQTPEPPCRIEPLDAKALVQTIGRIVELSERLFPGPVRLDYMYDPENPLDEWIVFDVVAKGEYKDFRDREFEWHEEVRKIMPGMLGEFRLCVMPQHDR